MRLYTGCALAGAVAMTMAVMPSALEAQAPSEQTRPATTRGQGRGERRANAFDTLGIHGFSIVLVIGDMQVTPPAHDTVPGAAKKALADMRDFLPYKSYRLLDAEWVLCCGGGSFAGVSGRVRGPEEQDYSYSVNTAGVADSKITVHFSMREAPVAVAVAPGASPGAAALSDTARAEYTRQLYEATKERDEAERQVQTLRPKVEVGMAPKEDVQAAQMRYERAMEQSQELRRMLGQVRGGTSRGSIAARSIMDSTFSIAVGETVVIGTSRLKGDQALIALLTAAAKPKPSLSR
jgi:hypothetical protein